MGKRLLSHIGVLCVFFGLIMAAGPSHAAATGSDFRSKDYFTKSLQNIEKHLDTVMGNMMQGSTAFSRHVNVLWLAALAIFIVLTMAKYVRGLADAMGVATAGIYAFFVFVIYLSYDTVLFEVWRWLSGLGGLMQQGIIGTDSMFGPVTFLSDLLSTLEFREPDGGWFDINFNGIFTRIVFGIFSVLISIGCVFNAAWPMLGYIIIKPIGYLLIPTMLFPKLSGLFDGGMKLLLGFGIYVIVGRVILSVTVLLMGGYFGVFYGGSTSLPNIVIEVTSLTDYLFLIIIMGISIFMLFATPFFVSMIVGGAKFSASGELASAATSTLRFIKR